MLKYSTILYIFIVLKCFFAVKEFFDQNQLPLLYNPKNVDLFTWNYSDCTFILYQLEHRNLLNHYNTSKKADSYVKTVSVILTSYTRPFRASSMWFSVNTPPSLCYLPQCPAINLVIVHTAHTPAHRNREMGKCESEEPSLSGGVYHSHIHIRLSVHTEQQVPPLSLTHTRTHTQIHETLSYAFFTSITTRGHQRRDIQN